VRGDGHRFGSGVAELLGLDLSLLQVQIRNDHVGSSLTKVGAISLPMPLAAPVTVAI
jgi:hypothetical protein